MASSFDGFRRALSFLTILPLPLPSDRDDASFARSFAWFPAVGGTIGLTVGLIACLVDPSLNPLLAAAVAVGLELAITGALHHDGFADCLDAVGATGRSRERKLEIMRDPNLGAIGGAALVSVMLIEVAALYTLFGRSAAEAVGVLAAAGAMGRLAAPLVAFRSTYARPEGKGRSFTDGLRPDVLMSAIFGAATVVALAWTTVPAPRLVAGIVAAVCAALWFRHWARRVLGGVTGDVYGAAATAARVGFLLLAVVVRL